MRTIRSSLFKSAAAAALAAGALFMATSASAQVNWSVGVAVPGVVVTQPTAPVYYDPPQPVYRPAPQGYYAPPEPVYRQDDWRWRRHREWERERARREWEREQHRDWRYRDH